MRRSVGKAQQSCWIAVVFPLPIQASTKMLHPIKALPTNLLCSGDSLTGATLVSIIVLLQSAFCMCPFLPFII